MAKARSGCEGQLSNWRLSADPPVCTGPIFAPQFRFLDFSRARKRQGIGSKSKRTRAFVVGDQSRTVCPEIFGIGVVAGTQAYDCMDPLSPTGIGDADNGAL